MERHRLENLNRIVRLTSLYGLLSRRPRQRERLSPSVRLSVCLSVCRQNAKTRFFQKLINLELWSLLTTYRKS